MDKIIELGGKGILIPAVLSILVFYAIRGLSGLHGRRSQYRKEFLELWDSAKNQDDFWLEVVVRHLIGVYLPADVIRLALAQSNRSEALLELADLWPLWRYDPETRQVGWLNQRHRLLATHRFGRKAILVFYFFIAGMAIASAVAAAAFGPNTFSGWIYGVFAITMVGFAMGLVMYEDTVRIASRTGSLWMNRINRSTKNSQEDPRQVA